ncbi:hypothetical protein [Archangium sp. Cb G35]|uniref:hypothetical protein n=1 Tax=Archangium sp. Cb G35 TaxID=1920190 RepID=UPI000B05C20F|nr:hypothetical protein [Archangium sp. Cb G35]
MATEITIHCINVGYHRVSHGGQQRLVRGLHPSAMVDCGSGQAMLATLLESDPMAHEEHEARLRAVGAHLWSQLGLSSPVRDELVIVSDDDDVLSLPWNILREDEQRLIDREVVVRCKHPSSVRERHLVKRPALLIALPPLESKAATPESGAWMAFHESPILDNARFHYAETEQELLHLLGNRMDLAYFPVSAPSQTKTSLSLAEYTLPAQALEQALQRGPPQILVLGGPGVHALRFSGWLGWLAARVPCLVVVPDSKDDGDQGTGAGARQFVSRLVQDGGTAARTCNRLARERASACAPLCISGEHPPLWEGGKPSWDDGWEVELDRTSQVGHVLEEIRKLQKRGGGCLLLVWHGPTSAGIERLHGRFFKAFNEQLLVHKELFLEWFHASSPRDDDFAGAYMAALGVQSLLEPREVNASLDQRLPERSNQGFTPVLYMHHGVLSASLYPARLDAVVLQSYLQWWSRTFAPARPAHSILLLSLAITTPAGADWVASLLGVLKDVRFNLSPGTRLISLHSLGNVEEGDVADFLENKMPHKLTHPDDVKAVALEIMERTKGVYEEVIRELEHLDYDWSAVRDAWRRRQKKETQ